MGFRKKVGSNSRFNPHRIPVDAMFVSRAASHLASTTSLESLTDALEEVLSDTTLQYGSRAQVPVLENVRAWLLERRYPEAVALVAYRLKHGKLPDAAGGPGQRPLVSVADSKSPSRGAVAA